MSLEANRELESLERIYNRITTTENEELPTVLERLLPKLLPLANQDDLRESVVRILSNVMQRCKLLKSKLPCAALLSLIEPSMMPFTSNLAIALLDACIQFESASSFIDCANAIISSLFKVDRKSRFSANAESLAAYSTYFITEIFQALRIRKMSLAPDDSQQDALRFVIKFMSDMLLDYTLCSGGVRKGNLGSAANGLSPGNRARKARTIF